jgi:hypothetical protein
VSDFAFWVSGVVRREGKEEYIGDRIESIQWFTQQCLHFSHGTMWMMDAVDGSRRQGRWYSIV